MATINKSEYTQEFVNESKYHIVKGCEASNAAIDYFHLWDESELDDNQHIFIAISKDTGIQHACFQEDESSPLCFMAELDDIDYLDEREWYHDYFEHLKYNDSALECLDDIDLELSGHGYLFNGEDPIVIDETTNTESFFDKSKHLDGILQACNDTDLAAMICGARYVYRRDGDYYYFL